MRRLKPVAVIMLAIAIGCTAMLKVLAARWQAHLDAGRKALDARRFHEARTELEAAREAATWFGDGNIRNGLTRIALGYLGIAEAKDDEAETQFRRALEALETSGRGETLDAAEAFHGLAVTAEHRARDAEAERFLEHALAIPTKILGPDHTHVAGTLKDLAWVHCNEGRYGEAERLARQALAIGEKSLAAEHLAVVNNRCDLAWFLIRQGKYEEARALLDPALTILDRAADSEALDLARCLSYKSSLELTLGRYRDAEDRLVRVLQIRERVLGPVHVDVAEALGNLASSRREQGR